jgi:hypothetical protein
MKRSVSPASVSKRLPKGSTLPAPARTRAHTGAVSVVQRGDSALRLNVHLNRVSG